MSKRFFNNVAGVGLGVTVLFAGCGKKADAPSNVNTAGAGDAAVVDPQTPKEPIWTTVEDPIPPALAYCDKLLAIGKYKRAQILVAGLKEQYPDMTMPPDVAERVSVIKEAEAKEAEFAPKLVDFKVHNAELKKAVKSSDVAGLIVLRKHLLENKDEELSLAITDVLVSLSDAESAHVMLERWKLGCTPRLSSKLLLSMGMLFSKHSETSDVLQAEFLENALLVLAAEQGPERSAGLRQALGKWNLTNIPKPTLNGYRDRIFTDKTYDEIHLMELMTLLFKEGCASDEGRFNSLFGVPTYETMANYLSSALTSPSKAIAAIAKVLGPLFGLPDMTVLTDGLSLHYTFNEPANAAFVRDVRSPRRVSSKLMGVLASGAIVDGLDARSIQFRGKGLLKIAKYSTIKGDRKVKGSSELHNIASKNYSFSIWVNPAFYPLKKDSRKDVFAIISKGGIKPTGLCLHRDKRVSLEHPLTDNKSCIAKSTQTVPENTWTHLVGVVNRKKGSVTVYINGEEAAKAAFTPNALPSLDYTRKFRFLLGNPGSSVYNNMMQERGPGGKTKNPLPKYDDNAFIGKMDELRIYARAITQTEIKQIYRIHAGFAK